MAFNIIQSCPRLYGTAPAVVRVPLFVFAVLKRKEVAEPLSSLREEVLLGELVTGIQKRKEASGYFPFAAPPFERLLWPADADGLREVWDMVALPPFVDSTLFAHVVDSLDFSGVRPEMVRFREGLCAQVWDVEYAVERVTGMMAARFSSIDRKRPVHQIKITMDQILVRIPVVGRRYVNFI